MRVTGVRLQSITREGSGLCADNLQDEMIHLQTDRASSLHVMVARSYRLHAQFKYKPFKMERPACLGFIQAVQILWHLLLSAFQDSGLRL